MRRDKKAAGGRPRFVLIEDIGKVHCRDGQYAVQVEEKVVEKVLAESTA
jgi:3-dehydroquinate synthetase